MAKNVKDIYTMLADVRRKIQSPFVYSPDDVDSDMANIVEQILPLFEALSQEMINQRDLIQSLKTELSGINKVIIEFQKKMP